MKKDGQKSATRPKKIRRRRTTASIGGTTQSAFANQSMSTILANQQGSASGDAAPSEAADAQPAEKRETGASGSEPEGTTSAEDEDR